ncbi:MAG: hypothetical protein E7508_06155 [Ruminococcus sp.]|nr:hypothetical protein [Ruminococcus sp.]
MLNLLKSDLYKMRKMTSLYVFNIITVLYNAITILFVSIIMSDDYTLHFCEFIQSGTAILPLFAGLFICLFSASEYKHGFIKNTASVVSDKSKIVLSKMVILIIFILISLAVYILSGSLFVAVLQNVTFSFEDITVIDSIMHISLQVLFLFAISMITIALVTVTKSSTFSCTFTVLITSGTVKGIIGTIWLIFTSTEIIPESIDISYVFISHYLSYVSCFGENKDRLIGLGVAAAYIIVTGVISIFTIRKKDIR